MSQKDPAKRAAYWATYYEANKARLIKAAQVRAEVIRLADPAAHNERTKKERKVSPEIVHERQRKSRLKCKVLAIRAYGGKCACCGIEELEFLNIDHIDGGGREHLKTLSSGSGALYRYVRLNNYPPGFQVLCFNCNNSKHIGGVCAHKRERTQSTDVASFGF